MNRRNCIQTLTGVAGASLLSTPQAAAARPANTSNDLPVSQYEPKSMLHVPETKVARSRFPVIDFHTHLSFGSEMDPKGKLHMNSTPEKVLALMDRKNLQTLVNLTGGTGAELEQNIAYWTKPHPGRLLTFTEPSWQKTPEPGYAQFQADELGRARKAGACGLKLLKTLGLYLRENVATGPLVKVDDKRFDPMWEAAGALNMPVAIHTADPEAFFLPIDRFNERWEELHAHPDWSFYGKDFPSCAELHEARLRVIARHPKTQFVCLHTADSENLPMVGEWMDRYPNMHVDIAARIGELGRQPRQSRKFFEKYQDRIVFATDAVPNGDDTPQQVYCDLLYEIYYRFLETEDEYFDYAPSNIPPQGRWRISGLGLPDSILKKVYFDNSARLLGMKA